MRNIYINSMVNSDAKRFLDLKTYPINLNIINIYCILFIFLFTTVIASLYFTIIGAYLYLFLNIRFIIYCILYTEIKNYDRIILNINLYNKCK